MGENICKWCNRQGVNIQNIQAAHIIQWNRQKKQPNQKKLAGDLNRHFSKEAIYIANRHMKRCSTLLITKEM